MELRRSTLPTLARHRQDPRRQHAHAAESNRRTPFRVTEPSSCSQVVVEWTNSKLRARRAGVVFRVLHERQAPQLPFHELNTSQSSEVTRPAARLTTVA